MFGGIDPPLGTVELSEVRLDRRAASLLLRFDLANYPENPPAKWVAQESNTIQLELEFSTLRSVTIDGWGTEMEAHLEVVRNAEGLIELTCGEAPRIKATAEWLRISKMSAYHRRTTPWPCG
ncbi:Imm50 family immunity protein [Rhodococcus gannanensis]|uniref:Imm50 family immunity protein n=1 Tax=Rhodococcus gannanensis TaxID=1960308 RepID=A0ABW4P0X9_9NOCA